MVFHPPRLHCTGDSPALGVPFTRISLFCKEITTERRLGSLACGFSGVSGVPPIISTSEVQPAVRQDSITNEKYRQNPANAFHALLYGGYYLFLISSFLVFHLLQVLPRLFRLYAQCLAKPFFRFLPVTFQIGQHTKIIPCTRVIGHLVQILPCANRITCHDYRRSRIDIGQHVVRKVVGGYLTPHGIAPCLDDRMRLLCTSPAMTADGDGYISDLPPL